MTSSRGLRRRIASPYAPEAIVASVPITPTRSRLARAAASAPGSTTPTTGTGEKLSIDGSARADAVLHATTSILTSRDSRKRMFASE